MNEWIKEPPYSFWSLGANSLRYLNSNVLFCGHKHHSPVSICYDSLVTLVLNKSKLCRCLHKGTCQWGQKLGLKSYLGSTCRTDSPWCWVDQLGGRGLQFYCLEGDLCSNSTQRGCHWVMCLLRRVLFSNFHKGTLSFICVSDYWPPEPYISFKIIDPFLASYPSLFILDPTDTTHCFLLGTHKL